LVFELPLSGDDSSELKGGKVPEAAGQLSKMNNHLLMVSGRWMIRH